MYFFVILKYLCVSPYAELNFEYDDLYLEYIKDECRRFFHGSATIYCTHDVTLSEAKGISADLIRALAELSRI